MIAGEYAVLEPNQPTVVIAIDRYITTKIEQSNENSLSLPQLGLRHITWKIHGNRVEFNCLDPHLNFIGHTLKVLHQFFYEKSISPSPCHLTITSDLVDDGGRKYGLGSSAAMVVAVVSSILSINRVQLSLMQIFKLSAIAHLKAQGNGSGADIAASTFGGWLYYTAFLPNWILNRLDNGEGIIDLMKAPWPNLTISPITPPANLTLCVGWTKEVARTGPMIEKVQKLRFNNPHLYNRFLEESTNAVHQLVTGFKTGDHIRASLSLSQNRQALQKLGEHVGISIETIKLKKLCDVAEGYGHAKSSGAGGGDCGIAFICDHKRLPALHDAWIKEDILPLRLNVSETGLIVTKTSEARGG